MPLRLNNRLDVRDLKGKWLEAIVVKIVPGQYMTVHFRGWNKKWDEDVPLDPEHFNDLLDFKVAEVGSYS